MSAAWFADTSWFLAMVAANDVHHQQATARSRQRKLPIITTAWVIAELADRLAGPPQLRNVFNALLATVRADPTAEIIGADDALFQRGIELYQARRDKEWTLTDGISFIVLIERGMTEALTADHHFEQAGFVALLKTS